MAKKKKSSQQRKSGQSVKKAVAVKQEKTADGRQFQKYTAQRRRDKKINAKTVKTSNADKLPVPEKTEGEVFAVSSADTEKTAAPDTPPKQKKARPPKRSASSAPKAHAGTLSDAAREYDVRRDDLYLQKLEQIKQWEDKFFDRLAKICTVAIIVIAAAASLWRIEVGRVSIEGKEDYELGINVFGTVAAVYENNPAAMIKEVPVKPGTLKTVVYRIIDDMYNSEGISAPYEEGSPILMGFYRAERAARFFESHDFSLGKADMQLRRVTKEDKKNAKKYAVNIGRAALIREYTEKYGGEADANFEKLRTSRIIEIIDREAVTREAAEAVSEIFTERAAPGKSNVPMVIKEDNVVPEIPAVPTAAPTAAPDKPAASNRHTTVPKTKAKTKQRASSSKSSSKSSSGSTAAPARSTPAATAQPETKPAQTLKPVREVSRPTANPVAGQ